MVVETEGDLLADVRPWSVIVHQVNCLGVAGAGLALKVREAFPGWYDAYRDYCSSFKEKEALLGSIHSFSPGRPDVIVCSVFAQLGVGKGRVMTDYSAWDVACRRLEQEVSAKNRAFGTKWELHAPYGIGCGLGGGDWRRMSELFEFHFGNSGVRLVLHRLPEKAVRPAPGFDAADRTGRLRDGE